MQTLIKVILLVVITVLITSCDYKETFNSMAPPAESKFAENYITNLREGNFEYIKSQMSEEILSQVNDELLLQMSNYFKGKDPISTELIGWQVNIINGVWHGNFTYEYQFDSGWNLANTAFKKMGETYKVIGLNVYQAEASQAQINQFSLSSKTAFHYIILILAIVVPIFITITTYVCIRTPIPKRKWLWIIFILIGIGVVKIDWTSGSLVLNVISFQLFGAGIVKFGLYAPWVISASLPLGAILFWIKRKKLIQLANEANNQLQPTAASGG